jgi:electron transport complex protein RnfC
VQYYRFAKSEIWEKEYNHKQSNIARQRHEFRVIRLETQKREREARLRKKREMLNRKKGAPGKNEIDTKKEAIAEALARVQEKKQGQAVKPKNMDNLSPEQERLIREADERRANKKTTDIINK